MSVTEQDRERADGLINAWDEDDHGTYDDLADRIAAALADERDRARADVVAYIRQLADRYKGGYGSSSALQASTLYDVAIDIETGRQ